MKLLLINFIILSILSISCTKEVKYFKEEIYQLAVSKDSRVEFVMGNNFEGEFPSCSNYIGHCINVFGVKMGLIYFLAIEYMSEADAKKAAKKYRGYYLKNWFFDDATGEPAVEELMTKLEAQKP